MYSWESAIENRDALHLYYENFLENQTDYGFELVNNSDFIDWSTNGYPEGESVPPPSDWFTDIF